ncbi:MAG: parB-like partition protein [Thermomicrobiales bacterium]|jgi:ParB family chromosome partitioning protein|nr:parB-like partition protein [Thermomicrobiales bacterium]
MSSDTPGGASAAAASGSERASSLPPRRGGLGRGLEALIPTLGEDAAPAAFEIDIDAITPNPYQPRIEMDQEALETLAASIRVHGVIQPLVVTHGPERGRYVLIAGERRWRAARLAGLGAVPAVVKEAAPRAMLELALVENVVRADLDPLEEAAAYRQLIDDFGLTQAAVAERVGRSRVSVTNTLRLLALPDRVQRALGAGEITEGHARALLGLPTAPEQVAALEWVLDKGLSVRQTEDLVRRWVAGEPPAGVRREPELTHGDDREEAVRQAFVAGLQRALGTRVQFRPAKGGGGALTIHYDSDEALNALYERLGGEQIW